MAGSRARSNGSMPCRTVTSARLQPWQPPSSRIRIQPPPRRYGHMAAVHGDRRVDLGVQDAAGRLREIPAALGGPAASR